MKIDALLAISVAMVLFTTSYYSSDEAYKYVPPALLFFGKWIVGVYGAGCTALQYFRSKSYAEHKARQQNAGQSKASGPVSPSI